MTLPLNNLIGFIEQRSYIDHISCVSIKWTDQDAPPSIVNHIYISFKNYFTHKTGMVHNMKMILLKSWHEDYFRWLYVELGSNSWIKYCWRVNTNKWISTMHGCIILYQVVYIFFRNKIHPQFQYQKLNYKVMHVQKQVGEGIKMGEQSLNRFLALAFKLEESQDRPIKPRVPRWGPASDRKQYLKKSKKHQKDTQDL